MLKVLSYLTLVALLFTSCLPSFKVGAPGAHSKRAEQLVAEKKYGEAISEYQLHFEERLASPSRPQDENPYFYYLLIGDLQLKLGDFASAQASYEKARDEKVTSTLVNERFLGLGRFLEEQGKYQEAIEVLQKYRDLDSLLFDYTIDKLHKQMIQSEELHEKER